MCASRQRTPQPVFKVTSELLEPFDCMVQFLTCLVVSREEGFRSKEINILSCRLVFLIVNPRLVADRIKEQYQFYSCCCLNN